eukprot:768628-Hanusia_phi.AAC.2
MRKSSIRHELPSFQQQPASASVDGRLMKRSRACSCLTCDRCLHHEHLYVLMIAASPQAAIDACARRLGRRRLHERLSDRNRIESNRPPAS